MGLDHSLYPDLEAEELPDQLTTLLEAADYIHRLCGAWDFYGFPPSADSLTSIRQWPEALAQFPILQSPAYCALCELVGVPHGPPEPYLGRLPWEEQDEIDGRDVDPCLLQI